MLTANRAVGFAACQFGKAPTPNYTTIYALLFLAPFLHTRGVRFDY